MAGLWAEALQLVLHEPHGKDYAPVSFTYLITPITIISFIMALLTALVLSPLLTPYFFPKFNQLPKDKRAFWNTLPASTINAIVACTLILVAIFTGSIDAFNYLVKSESAIGFAAMQFGFGYFVGDLIVCSSQESLRDVSTILHHLSSLSSVLLGLVFQGRWMILIMARLFTELSTPFVNLLWVCVLLKVPKTKCIFRFAGSNVTLTFLGTRIFAMPLMWIITYVILRQEENEPDVVPGFVRLSVVILMACLDILNVIWSVKIVKGCLKMLQSGGTKTE